MLVRRGRARSTTRFLRAHVVPPCEGVVRGCAGQAPVPRIQHSPDSLLPISHSPGSHSRADPMDRTESAIGVTPWTKRSGRKTKS
jgi:hypothetical protein